MEQVIKRERIPNITNFSDHQKGPWGARARFIVLVWHRKAWKTSTAICKLIEQADRVPGTYWYIAPTYGEAKRTVWDDPEMLQKYLPPSIWDKRNKSNLTIPFNNGSILYILSADNPDVLRGPNPKGVVLDEYDTMKSEMWSAVVQPIMMANPNAWCWFVGTYKGRKDLMAKFNYAKREMEEKGDASQWYCSMLKASTSGIIAPEDLLEAQKTTTEAFFKQEYECEPLENASAVFRNIDACTKVVDMKSGLLIPWTGYGEPNPGHKYQIGLDLAKYNDFTVITPFNLTNFRAYRQDRFNQIDWPLQKAKVELAYMKHSRGSAKAKVVMDGTGLGDPIYDDLKKRIPNIESVNFGGHRREDLLNNLAIIIEQGRIKIPYEEQLIAELQSFQFVLKTSKGGKARIAMEVPEGVHDDCVMSLALAVWEIPEEPVRDMDEVRQRKEDLRQFDSRRARSGSLTGSRDLRTRGF